MTTQKTVTPKLYIIMRNDMGSLTPGKAIAQGGHACTKFMANMHYKTIDALSCAKKLDKEKRLNAPALIAWNTWLGIHGFGTKITLEAPGPDIPDMVNEAASKGYYSGLVVDPTYPLKDGDSMHHLSVMTCGYIFDHDGELKNNLPNFKQVRLHR